MRIDAETVGKVRFVRLQISAIVVMGRNINASCTRKADPMRRLLVSILSTSEVKICVIRSHVETASSAVT